MVCWGFTIQNQINLMLWSVKFWELNDTLMMEEMKYFRWDFYIYIIAILSFFNFTESIIETNYYREKIKINQHICFLCSLSAHPISCPPVYPTTLTFADLIVSEGTLLADYSPYHPDQHICFSRDHAEQNFLFCYSFETQYTFFVLHEVFENSDSWIKMAEVEPGAVSGADAVECRNRYFYFRIIKEESELIITFVCWDFGKMVYSLFCAKFMFFSTVTTTYPPILLPLVAPVFYFFLFLSICNLPIVYFHLWNQTCHNLFVFAAYLSDPHNY